MSGHADTIRRVLQQLGLPRYGRFERPAAQEGLDALDALATEIQQQADRIAWLEGEVAGWRIKNQQLRDALDSILSVVENASVPYERLHIGALARAALDGTPSEAA